MAIKGHTPKVDLTLKVDFDLIRAVQPHRQCKVVYSGQLIS